MSLKLLSFAAVFVIGFLCCLLCLNFIPSNDVISLTGFFTHSVDDRASPADRITADDIAILDDRIVIHINNSRVSIFENSKSMDPFLDSTSMGIEISPPEGSLQEGDIIAYATPKGTVIHRIHQIIRNESGTFYITKGDNTPLVDPEPVTFSQIESVLVGILY